MNSPARRSPRTFSLYLAPTALAVSLLAVAGAQHWAPQTVMTATIATPCSYGTQPNTERDQQELEREEGGEVRDEPACLPILGGESRAEMMAIDDSFTGQRGIAAPGVMTQIFAQRDALATPAAQTLVPGSAGVWKPYGKGPLISNDSRFPRVNGLGLVELAGRVDSLDYDPVNKRLFASVGTGGVWMSNDLATS